ncbi:MAG: hypothetical protein ACI9VR_002693 [Cognaticolwellia sp.]|jgi:hypothetical protein
MTQTLAGKLAPVAPLALMGFLALPSVAEAASPVRSQGNFGIGLGSGYRHSGISMKYFAGDTHSLQGVVGTYGYDGSLGLSGSYLYEMPTIIGDNTGLELGWAVGGGPSIGLGDNFLALGAHGVIGLEFNIQPVPIDIVLEYKPSFRVYPDVEVDLYNFAGHIRFYPWGWSAK